MSLLAKFAIFSIAIFVVVCGTALLFSARPTPVVGVDAGALAHSVRSSDTGCSQGPDEIWDCAVSVGDTTTHYRVEVEWAGCWDATRIRGPVTADTPRTLSGCVDIWDHLQLEDTFN